MIFNVRPTPASHPSMALRVAFAEQSTGIVTTPSGERALGVDSFQRVDGMWEALTLAREYFQQHPDHEAWIGSSVSGHRLVPPAAQTFPIWIERFRREHTTGAIRLDMTFGEVISCLGWPDDCSIQHQRSPLAVILRYQPHCTDFHFDEGGRLCLVFQDDPDDSLTILAR